MCHTRRRVRAVSHTTGGRRTSEPTLFRRCPSSTKFGMVETAGSRPTFPSESPLADAAFLVPLPEPASTVLQNLRFRTSLSAPFTRTALSGARSSSCKTSGEHPLTGHPASSKDDRGKSEQASRARRCVGSPGRGVQSGVSTLDPANPHSDGEDPQGGVSLRDGIAPTRRPARRRRPTGADTRVASRTCVITRPLAVEGVRLARPAGPACRELIKSKLNQTAWRWLMRLAPNTTSWYAS